MRWRPGTFLPSWRARRRSAQTSEPFPSVYPCLPTRRGKSLTSFLFSGAAKGMFSPPTLEQSSSGPAVAAPASTQPASPATAVWPLHSLKPAHSHPGGCSPPGGAVAMEQWHCEDPEQFLPWVCHQPRGLEGREKPVRAQAQGAGRATEPRWNPCLFPPGSPVPRQQKEPERVPPAVFSLGITGRQQKGRSRARFCSISSPLAGAKARPNLWKGNGAVRERPFTPGLLFPELGEPPQIPPVF